MPSSSRKQRHSRRQQKLVDATPPTSDDYPSPPQPYHDSSTPPPPPPPPPGRQSLQNRTSSTDSKLSDITFDDNGSGPLDSVFEYSDTSDDADNYFLPQDNYRKSPPSLLDNMMGKKNHILKTSAAKGSSDNHHRRTNRTRNDSGQSAFREMKKEGGNKSCKIVRFISSSEIGDDFSSDFECAIGDSKKDSLPTTAAFNKNEKYSRPILGKWMEKMSQAFHSPTGIQHKNDNTKNRRRRLDKKPSGHRRNLSQTVKEYPHSMINLRDGGRTLQHSALKDLDRSSLENSPLISGSKRASYGVYDAGSNISSISSNYHLPLKGATSNSETAVNQQSTTSNGGIEIEKASDYSVLDYIGDSEAGILASSRRHCSIIKSRTMAAKVAAYFLMDYEDSRVATLPSSFENITARQLVLYNIYFSWQWRWFVNLAIIVLFLSQTQNLLATAIMHSCVIVVFAVDILTRENMYGIDSREDTTHTDRKLVRPMVAFLCLLGLEAWMWWGFATDLGYNGSTSPLFCSFFKPLVFFYVSSRARESLEAIWKISQIVIRVLIIEFVLILAFAAVACRMFGNEYDSFQNISSSWYSLFACELFIKFLDVVRKFKVCDPFV
jgi:hypothetical protein